MKFISTGGQAPSQTFSEAIIQGLAPDGGLYVPESIPRLPDSFWKTISEKKLPEIGFEIASRFIKELEEEQLKSLIREAHNFDAPLVHLHDSFYILELFHGPTLAFKDFGARFMARAFASFRKESDRDVVILAATSGDTGSAVAQGFLGVEGFKVCLLYPSGKVSKIQEQQLTTAGHNVLALKVDGTFDDCQDMVKKAFTDQPLNEKVTLSSANSINIARLLPQSFYFAYALGQLPEDSGEPVFSVPSGNFGNLTAGLLARKMGMPTKGFIAATNINDVVPEYLKTGHYEARPSRQTISNAMDIGNPSNFVRILHLYDKSFERIRKQIRGASFTDSQTKAAIKDVYDKTGYILDPHTAVGYLAANEFQNDGGPHIILSTAHPAKFRDVIQPVIDTEIPLPERLKECMAKENQSIGIKPSYEDLKEILKDQYA